MNDLQPYRNAPLCRFDIVGRKVLVARRILHAKQTCHSERSEESLKQPPFDLLHKHAPTLSFRPCDTNTLPLCHFDRSAKNEREAEKSILIKCRSCNYYPHEISPRTRFARLVEMTGDFRLRLRSSAKAYRSRRAEDVTPYGIVEQFLSIVGSGVPDAPHNATIYSEASAEIYTAFALKESSLSR